MTDPRTYLQDVLAKAEAATEGPWRGEFYEGVLSPLSVTAEQVEADVERLFYLDPPYFDPYSGRDSFRAGYLAALAAMGIPVVES